MGSIWGPLIYGNYPFALVVCFGVPTQVSKLCTKSICCFLLGVGFGRCSLRRFREEKGEKGKECRALGLGALNPQPKP